MGLTERALGQGGARGRCLHNPEAAHQCILCSPTGQGSEKTIQPTKCLTDRLFDWLSCWSHSGRLNQSIVAWEARRPAVAESICLTIIGAWLAQAMGTRLEERHPMPWGTMRMDEFSPPSYCSPSNLWGSAAHYPQRFLLSKGEGKAQLWNQALQLLSLTYLSLGCCLYPRYKLHTAIRRVR